jgi:hypothetical protein
VEIENLSLIRGGYGWTGIIFKPGRSSSSSRRRSSSIETDVEKK